MELQIASLSRALTVLNAFNPEQPTLSLAELSRRSGLNKATLLRVLSTLKHFNYVAQDADGSYHVGAGALALSRSFQAWVNPQRLINPVLEQLVKTTQESASFNVREGQTRVVVYRVDSPHRIRDHVRVGDVLPVNAGAVGKVLSAFSVPEEERNLDDLALSCLAMTHGEIERDAAAIACPVFGPDGTCEGALALTGPAYRFSEDTLPGMQQALLEAAATLTERWGGDSAPARAALFKARTSKAGRAIQEV